MSAAALIVSADWAVTRAAPEARAYQAASGFAALGIGVGDAESPAAAQRHRLPVGKL